MKMQFSSQMSFTESVGSKPTNLNLSRCKILFNFSHDRPLERDPRDRGGDRDGLPGLLPQEVLPDQELLQGLNFVLERIASLLHVVEAEI